MKKLLTTALFAVSALCISLSAHATTYSYYTDTESFGTAAMDRSLAIQPYSFPSIAGSTQSLGASTTVGPLTFTNGAGGASYNHDDSFGDPMTYLVNDGTTPTVTTTGNDTFAIGFFVAGTSETQDITVKVDEFRSRTFTINGDGEYSFIGFIGSSNINSITFSSTGGQLDILAFATDAPYASPVPEPSSFALLGTGVLGIGGMVRRRFLRA